MDINEEMKLHQWAIDMAEQKSSGLSQKEWCRINGVHTNTFRYRCRKVRMAMEEKLNENSSKEIVQLQSSLEPEEQLSPFFAKVNLTPETPASGGINIRVHDTLINIAPDAPENHVRMVLEILTYA